MKKDTYIPTLTIKNIKKLSFSKMLKALRPYVSEEVPEGVLGDHDAYMAVDRQLGRFANLYAYMIELYAYLANEVRRAKRKGDKKAVDSLTGKRDAVYELARAVKYKYDACSRMLTATLGYEEGETRDTVNYEARDKSTKGKKREMKGWNNVS